MKRKFTPDELNRLEELGYNTSSYKGELIEFPDEAPESTALGAGGRAALANALPAIAGAAAGAGGWALGASLAPATGGLSFAIPLGASILTGLGGSYLAKEAQDVVTPASIQAKLAQDAQEHPLATRVGGIASNLAVMRPSLSMTKDALKGAVQLPAASVAGSSAIQTLNPAYRNALANTALGAGLGGVTSAGVQLAETGDIDFGDVLMDTVAGAAMNKPTALGRKVMRLPVEPGLRPIEQTEELRAGQVAKPVQLDAHVGAMRESIAAQRQFNEMAVGLAEESMANQAKLNADMQRVQQNQIDMQNAINDALANIQDAGVPNLPYRAKQAEYSQMQQEDAATRATETYANTDVPVPPEPPAPPKPVSQNTLRITKDKYLPNDLNRPESFDRERYSIARAQTPTEAALQQQMAEQGLSTAPGRPLIAAVDDLLQRKNIGVRETRNLETKGMMRPDAENREIYVNPDKETVDIRPHEGLHYEILEIEKAASGGNARAKNFLDQLYGKQKEMLDAYNSQLTKAGKEPIDAHEFATTEQGARFIQEQLNLKKETSWKKWWNDTKALWNQRFGKNPSVDDLQRALNYRFVNREGRGTMGKRGPLGEVDGKMLGGKVTGPGVREAEGDRGIHRDEGFNTPEGDDVWSMTPQEQDIQIRDKTKPMPDAIEAARKLGYTYDGIQDWGEPMGKMHAFTRRGDAEGHPARGATFYAPEGHTSREAIEGYARRKNEAFGVKYAQDDRGVERTPREQQQNSPEFKKWFEGSKVVDKEGKPLIVYHGTGNAFDTFRTGGADARGYTYGEGAYFTPESTRASEYSGLTRSVEDRIERRGLDEIERTFYDSSPQVKATYLSIKNPYKVSSDAEVNDIGMKLNKSNKPEYIKLATEIANKNNYDSWQAVSPTEVGNLVLRKKGYDGIIKEWHENDPLEIVAFHPEQIKSATGNRGTFDATNPDIRYAQDDRGLERTSPPRAFMTSAERVVRDNIKGAQPFYQVINTIKNKVPPGEWAMLQDMGIEQAFKEGKHSAEDVTKWIQENEPKVEVKKFGENKTSKIESDQVEEQLVNRQVMIEHELDTVEPNWRAFFEFDDGIHNVRFPHYIRQHPNYRNAQAVDAKIAEYNHLQNERFSNERTNNPRGWNEIDDSGAHWQSVAPKSEKDMPGYVELAVVKPVSKQKEDAAAYAEAKGKRSYMDEEGEIKFPSSHKFPPNTLGFSRGYMEGDTFHVLESQTDIAQEVSDGVFQVLGHPELGEFPSKQAALKAAEQIEPLVAKWQEMNLKNAIEHARSVGAKRIAIQDAESAMLMEGHDTAAKMTAEKAVPVRPDLHEAMPGYRAPLRKSRDGFAPIRAKMEKDLDLKPASWTYITQNIREGYVTNDRYNHVYKGKDGNYYFFDMDTSEPFRLEGVKKVISQEKGMRLHYDQILPKILKELTGQEGERVSFGEHKMAKDDNGFRDVQFPELEGRLVTIPDNIMYRPKGTKGKLTGRTQINPAGEVSAEFDDGYSGKAFEKLFKLKEISDSEVLKINKALREAQSKPEYRKDLIFKNPDGTPKTDVSARVYDLPAEPRTEPYSYFEKRNAEADRGLERTPLTPDENVDLSKKAFFRPMEATFDKVERISKAHAQAARNFEARRDQYIGIGNEALDKLSKFNKDEVNRVMEAHREAYRNDTEPTLTGSNDKAISEILSKYYGDIADARRELGIRINNREAGKNQYYVPDMMNADTLDVFINDPLSPEAARLKEEWANHVIEQTEGKMPIDKIRKDIDEYIGALNGKDNNYRSLEFGAIRRAAGYGLPEGLRDKDAINTLSRYARRASADLAFFQEIQNRPEIAGPLHLKDQHGKTIQGYDSVDLSQSPLIQNMMQWITGNVSGRLQKQPKLNALVRLVNNSLLGPATGARDLVSVPVNALPYISRLSDLTAVWEGLMNTRANAADALRTAAKQPSIDRVQFADVLDAPDRTATLLNKAADVMRKAQGREYLENLAREITFSMGKELGRANILAAKAGDKKAKAWLEKFSTLVEGDVTKLEGDSLEQALNQIGKNFTDRNQGTYGGRGLPLGVVDSQFAPFLSLQKWGLEKSNVIYNDVWKPFMTGENRLPMLTYALGSVMTGAAIQELNKLMSGKKGQDPTVKEALASGDPKNIALELVTLMQLGSYAGIMSDMTKAATDSLIKGKTPRSVVSFPTASAAIRTSESVTDMIEAIRQGENPWEVLKEFTMDMASQNIQSARLIANRTGRSDDVERSEKFRDRRVFNELEGKPAQEMPRTNPYLDLDAKEFKRTEDLGEASRLVPKLVGNVVKGAKSAEALKKGLRGLKANSYQTVPSPEEQPEEFIRYMNFLTETQGKEEAERRIADYFRQRTINKAKSQMIP